MGTETGLWRTNNRVHGKRRHGRFRIVRSTSFKFMFIVANKVGDTAQWYMYLQRWMTICATNYNITSLTYLIWEAYEYFQTRSGVKLWPGVGRTNKIDGIGEWQKQSGSSQKHTCDWTIKSNDYHSQQQPWSANLPCCVTQNAYN